MTQNPLSAMALASRLSVEQLQLAMQHKTLPAYIALPLIQQKTEERAQMQNAQALQQQQMPSVAQQIMQRVAARRGIPQLPTRLLRTPMSGVGQGAPNRGIEQLPTNLPTEATMAGGGIVAFSEGGTPASRWWEQNIAGRTREMERKRLAAEAEEQNIAAAQFDEAEKRRVLRQNLMSQYGSAAGIPGLFTPQTDEERQGAQNVISQLGRLSTSQLQAVTEQGPSALPPRPTTAPTPPIPPTQKVDATVTQPQAEPEPTPQPTDIYKLLNIPKPDTSASALATTQKLLGDYRQQSEAREKNLFEGLQANRDRLQGKAFEGYENMLRSSAEQAGADKDQAKSMALFKAGLAMMAGTHPNALVNIGRGLAVGAQDYQNAYESLRKAEHERIKEFALIEQARRAETISDMGRRDNLMIKAFDHAQKRDDHIFDALNRAGISDVGHQQALNRAISTASIRLLGRGGGADAKTQLTEQNKIIAELDPLAVDQVVKQEMGLGSSSKPLPLRGTDPRVDEIRTKIEGRMAQNEYARRNLLRQQMSGELGQQQAAPLTGFKRITE